MTPSTRHRTYDDPLDLIWRRLAHDLGWTLAHSNEVYASWSGNGTLTLCTPDDYDPDDSLAQMIFHEVCHALVQGPSRRSRIDWGMRNETPQSDALAEHACHRLQAALAGAWGLRDLLAVTTDWRPYWDSLPDNPLAPGDDPAIAPAQHAWVEAVRGPWAPHLTRALRATAQLADTVRHSAPPESLWHTTRPLHPQTERPLHPDAARTCATCTWNDNGRCLHAGVRLAPESPACHRHEVLEPHACLGCGACCREGFNVVGVLPDDAVHEVAPDWIVHDDHGAHLPRPGGTCIALEKDCTKWHCTIYAHRPQACRDFERGSEHCLTARRRVGLAHL